MKTWWNERWAWGWTRGQHYMFRALCIATALIHIYVALRKDG